MVLDGEDNYYCNHPRSGTGMIEQWFDFDRVRKLSILYSIHVVRSDQTLWAVAAKGRSLALLGE